MFLVFNPETTHGCVSLGDVPLLCCACCKSETPPYFCLLGRISTQHGSPPAETLLVNNTWSLGGCETPISGAMVALHLQKPRTFSSGMPPDGSSQNPRFSLWKWWSSSTLQTHSWSLDVSAIQHARCFPLALLSQKLTVALCGCLHWASLLNEMS